MSLESRLDTRAHTKYDQLIEATRALPPTPTVVVHPCDETSLVGAVEAAALGLREYLSPAPTLSSLHR